MQSALFYIPFNLCKINDIIIFNKFKRNEMRMKNKGGESEAITILENKGYEFDHSYQDDNSKDSMPDFKYKDGRYLEITHTIHNYKAINNDYINKFSHKSVKEQLEKLNHIEKMSDIVNNSVARSDSAIKEYQKIALEAYGYDIKTGKFNERKMNDIPLLEHSDSKVIEAINIKGQKHSDKEIDLFIFVTDDEYKIVSELWHQRHLNGCAINLFNYILNSPFFKIYLCVWDYHANKYETEKPQMIIFKKDSNRKSLNATFINE